LEGLVFLIVESQWLKRFNLHLCPSVVLPFRKQFSKKNCLSWWKKLNNNMSYLLWHIVIWQIVIL
jgi:hypothetical protein